MKCFAVQIVFVTFDRILFSYKVFWVNTTGDKLGRGLTSYKNNNPSVKWSGCDTKRLTMGVKMSLVSTLFPLGVKELIAFSYT